MVEPTSVKRKLAGNLAYHVDVKRVIRRQFTQAIPDGVLKMAGRLIYEVKNLRVGVFTATGDA